MDNIYTGSSKFVMSLDSLDIALLPTLSSRMNNNVAPLWTANSFNANSNKYFEFEIITKSDKMESNYEGSCIDNDTTSTAKNDPVRSYCHICDIEVPAAYIIDHENSLKHKAYIKIADAVLDRTRRHMLKKNCESVPKDNSMYFCAPCSTVVQAINKSNHEISKGHKQSLSLDRLLYELVALYTNNYHETVEDYATVTTNLNVDSINEQKFEFDTNLNNNNNNVLSSDIKAHLEDHEKTTVKCHKVDKTKPDEHNIKVKPLQNGFVFNSHTSFDMLNANELLKGTNDDLKTKAIVDNTNLYADFKESDNGTYICSMCNIKIHGNDIESHVNGNKHAWHSKSDLHYLLRQEGVSDLICKICNAYIPDGLIEIKEHVATKDHVDKYKDKLKNNYVIQQKGNFFCKPCDVVITKRNELYHIEKINHEDKLASFKEIAAELSTVEQNTNINEPINSGSKLPPKPDSNYCTICDVYIPNKTYNIKTHYDGARHKKNVDNIANKIKVAVADQMEETANEKELKCKACKSIVPNKKENIQEHINGKKHESCLHKILEENLMEVLGEEYICRLCKHNVSLRDLFSHINLKRHINSLDTLSTVHKLYGAHLKSANATTNTNTISTNQQKDNKTVNDDVNDDVKDNKTVSVDEIYLNFKHHFMENKETNQIICKVCNNLSIPNTMLDLVNHATEQTHLDTYDNMMIDNLIFDVENNSYFCGICSCLVPLSGEVHHVRGGRHNGNYTKAISNEECDLCEISTNDINISEHLISDKHTQNVMKKQTLILYCKCCKSLVPKNNFDDHVKTCHELAVKGKICKSLVPKNDIDDHVKTCHELAVKGKICFCTICDPFLPGSSRSK